MADGQDRMIRFVPMATAGVEHPNGRLSGGAAKAPSMRQKYGEQAPLTYRLPAESLGRPSPARAGASERIVPAASQRAAGTTAVRAAARIPEPPAVSGGRTALEDALFSQWRHQGLPVQAVCMGGAVVRGRLLGFDAYGLVVESADGPTILFKHGLVSICCPGGGPM